MPWWISWRQKSVSSFYETFCISPRVLYTCVDSHFANIILRTSRVIENRAAENLSGPCFMRRACGTNAHRESCNKRNLPFSMVKIVTQGWPRAFGSLGWRSLWDETWAEMSEKPFFGIHSLSACTTMPVCAKVVLSKSGKGLYFLTAGLICILYGINEIPWWWNSYSMSGEYTDNNKLVLSSFRCWMWSTTVPWATSTLGSCRLFYQDWHTCVLLRSNNQRQYSKCAPISKRLKNPYLLWT